MCAAVKNRLCLPSVTVTAGPRVNAGLAVTQDVLLSHGAVSISTNGVVAVVAIVAVGYPVIYQGTVLILTELADQLGFQS